MFNWIYQFSGTLKSKFLVGAISTRKFLCVCVCVCVSVCALHVRVFGTTAGDEPQKLSYVQWFLLLQAK